MRVSFRMMLVVAFVALCACPGPVDGKDKCATQADCLTGYVCTNAVCVSSDAGVADAGSISLAGNWNLVVRAAANGNAALRSYHTVLATEATDGTITFATPFCNLYGVRNGATVTLRAPQNCTVPTGTALSLDQETSIGSGTFGNRVNVTAPYCYTIWLSSSTTAALSDTTYRFFGDGGVSPNGNATAACNQPSVQNNAALQFDLTR